MERVVTGLQQRRVVTEKEKRILAYHEGGHAVMSHLMGDVAPLQKVTIIARGDALGYAWYVPTEDRYMQTKEELIDLMKVALGGRAAEQIVFGRVTTGAANDLEKVTEIARAMVFEYGMSEVVTSRTMRADNYALSEETKRLRDSEQALLTDGAFAEAVRSLTKHRAALDRVAHRAAREGDARSRGGRQPARRHPGGVDARASWSACRRSCRSAASDRSDRPRAARGAGRLRGGRAAVLRRGVRAGGDPEARAARGPRWRLVPLRSAAAAHRRRAGVRSVPQGASGLPARLPTTCGRWPTGSATFAGTTSSPGTSAFMPLTIRQPPRVPRRALSLR